MKLKWLKYLQTVQTLIRCCILQLLILVCTVCQLPVLGSPDYNGLNSIQLSLLICFIAIVNAVPNYMKMYLLTCVPNKDLNQPVHPHSLNRIFIVFMKKLCIVGIQKAPSAAFDQNAPVHGFIWIFAGHICQKVHYLTLPLTSITYFTL